MTRQNETVTGRRFVASNYSDTSAKAPTRRSLRGEAFAERVNRLVFGFVCGHEFFVGVAGQPEIKREVNIRTKGVVKKPGFPVVRIGSKELGPVAGRAIDLLELFFATRLDFVLPED
jgi:hypothetical protein